MRGLVRSFTLSYGECKEFILRSFDGGQNTRDIASALKISEADVERYLHQALESRRGRPR